MKRFFCLFLTLTLGVVIPCIPVEAKAANDRQTKLEVDYIPTNSAGKDQGYIARSTAQESALWRWCDGQREIVYQFDLSAWHSPLFRVQISNNYLLQVSANDTDFTTVADYGALSGKTFDGSYYNTAFYTIQPSDYSCTDRLYLRIANCNPSAGWGGAVSSISIFHQVPAQPSDDIPLFGDIDKNGQVDASDALLALQHSVGLTTLDEQSVRTGDCNLDGRVDASDALQMLQLSVQLIDTTKAEQEQKAVLRPGSRVLFVGDSVTDANRNREDPTDMGQGYVAQIQTLMSLDAAQYDLTFVNRGLNGTRTHDWLPLIDATLEEVQADVVSVALGVNDTWRRYDQGMLCSAEEYGDNLRTILSAAQKTGAKLVVMSPFALPGSTVDITGWHEEDLNAKIAMCERVAQEFDAIYIPMNEIFYRDYEGDSSYTWDGIHPNPSGSIAIAMSWLERVPFSPLALSNH